MVKQNGTKDASLEAWREFCVLLNTPCAKSEGAQAFLQQQNLSFLIQQRQPPRAVRVVLAGTQEAPLQRWGLCLAGAEVD